MSGRITPNENSTPVLTNSFNLQRYENPFFTDHNQVDVIPTSWGKLPQEATCLHCRHFGLSVTKRRCGRGVAVMCMVLSCIGGCCILTPLFMETEHICSNCKKRLGYRNLM
mmetsp:Transcript_16906/g.30277  ORF Transcript_16906/g.30277 Transcript_16906/m.30277 type:complete len:111 (-) Transcript_16906:2369-2701(-)